MNNIVPDYSGFDEIRLLKLYDEIGGLTEENASILLSELETRGLIKSSLRREVPLNQEFAASLNADLRAFCGITEDEFKNVKDRNVLESLKGRIILGFKSNLTFLSAFSIIFSLVMLAIFFRINSQMNLFDHRLVLDLGKIFIIVFTLGIPLYLLLSSVYLIVKTKKAREAMRIKEIVGTPKLQLLRSKRTKSYSASVKKKTFYISEELYTALNEQERFVFYYLEYIDELLGIEIVGSNQYEIITS